MKQFAKDLTWFALDIALYAIFLLVFIGLVTFHGSNYVEQHKAAGIVIQIMLIVLLVPLALGINFARTKKKDHAN